MAAEALRWRKWSNDTSRPGGRSGHWCRLQATRRFWRGIYPKTRRSPSRGTPPPRDAPRCCAGVQPRLLGRLSFSWTLRRRSPSCATVAWATADAGRLAWVLKVVLQWVPKPTATCCAVTYPRSRFALKGSAGPLTHGEPSGQTPTSTWFFFLPTSRNVLPTFQTFSSLPSWGPNCTDGSSFYHFQVQVRKRGVLGWAYGCFVYVHIPERGVWRLSQEQGFVMVFWAKWEPIWAKWDPSG